MGRPLCLRYIRSGSVLRWKVSLTRRQRPFDITSRTWSPEFVRLFSVLHAASVRRFRPAIGTVAMAAYRSQNGSSGFTSASGSSPAPSDPAKAFSTSRFLSDRCCTRPDRTSWSQVCGSYRSVRTCAMRSGSRPPEKPSLVRATLSAEDRTVWLMMRSEAVALAMPSR